MAAYKAIISFLQLNQFQIDDFFNKEQTWKIFLEIW